MTRQTLEILGGNHVVQGYVEIGSMGRYVSELRKHLRIEGPMVLVDDVAPSNSPIDIVERGQLTKLGQFVPLNDYKPLSSRDIADHSIDLVTCYIGLHHAPPELLDGFVRSIWRALRPGGLFILRDHDVKTPEMNVFVSLVHTVFNAGLGLAWEVNQKELRHFASIYKWSQYLEARGFKDTGRRILQANDPSDNTLLAFVKSDSKSG
jgi:SAM-dependent methyltransferase